MSLHEYHRPTEHKKAAALLRRKEPTTLPIYLGPRPTALHERNWDSAVDLSRLGIDFIKQDVDGGIRIGSLAPLQDIVTSPHLQEYAGGLLPRAAGMAAHLGLRNAANMGGVLTTTFGAPELRLALLVVEAETISAEGFITEVILPAQELVTSLERVARTPMDEAIVAVAVGLQLGDGIIAHAKLAVSGIGIHPIRIEEAETMLTSQALTPKLTDAIATITLHAADPAYQDYRGSSEYRREMAYVLMRRAVETAWQQQERHE